MYAIKTKPHNFNWRSIKTKSRDIQLLNTKGHSELGKRSENPFHLRKQQPVKSQSTDVFCQNASVKVLQFHPQFDDECLHKAGLQFSIIKSATPATTSLFRTISSQPQTWTSPRCLLFYGGGGRVWVTAEAVYQSPWSQMTEMRWDGWTSKLLLELCTLPSLSPSSSLSACWVWGINKAL